MRILLRYPRCVLDFAVSNGRKKRKGERMYTSGVPTDVQGFSSMNPIIWKATPQPALKNLSVASRLFIPAPLRNAYNAQSIQLASTMSVRLHIELRTECTSVHPLPSRRLPLCFLACGCDQSVSTTLAHVHRYLFSSSRLAGRPGHTFFWRKKGRRSAIRQLTKSHMH